MRGPYMGEQLAQHQQPLTEQQSMTPYSEPTYTVRIPLAKAELLALTPERMEEIKRGVEAEFWRLYARAEERFIRREIEGAPGPTPRGLL